MQVATAPKPVTVRQGAALITWIEAALLVGLVVRLYASTLADLAMEWWTLPEASHGLLIPPLAFYVAYLRRDALRAIPPARDRRGLWLLAAGCAVFLIGRLAAEFFLTRMSFVVILVSILWTFWGWARVKALAFPLVLLATMVPLPGLVYNSLAAPLQLFASSVATDLAQYLGVSIFREGNIIHLSGETLGVAEACSGLHSLSALMIGSLLLGALNHTRFSRKVLLFLVAAPLAVAVNVVRVTGTAVLADVRPEYAMGFYHSFSGWFVFVLGFATLWVISNFLLREKAETH